MIVGFRVDERLIHGQVALAWSRALQTEAIIVGNDRAANDSVQKTALKLAAPTGVKVVVSTLEKTAELLNNPKSDNMKIMVVVKCIEDAYEICKKIKAVKEINIGSQGRYASDYDITGNEVREEIYKGEVYLANSGKEAVKKLWDMGIEVYNQQLPSQPKRSIKF